MTKTKEKWKKNEPTRRARLIIFDLCETTNAKRKIDKAIDALIVTKLNITKK